VIDASRARKRTKKLDAKIVRRYQAGESCRAIAESLSTSFRSVREGLIRLGIPRRPARRQPGTAHDAEIVRRYQAGETLRAIAGRLSKSHETVRAVLIRLGIPPRPTGQRRRSVHDADAISPAT